jgi:hypothetical protein
VLPALLLVKLNAKPPKPSLALPTLLVILLSPESKTLSEFLLKNNKPMLFASKLLYALET